MRDPVRPLRAGTGLMCAGVLLAALAGCNDAPPAPQVRAAARVNGESIPADWLSAQAGLGARRSGGEAGAGESRKLEQLVDQTLMLQAARQRGLDRDPQVARQVEAASREALARIYLERVVDTVPAPSDAEIRRYYESQPLLFQQRRIYKLQESRVVWPVADSDVLKARVHTARSAEETVKILKAAGLGVDKRVLTEPAERLPLAALTQIAALKPGRSLVLLENDPRKPASAPTRVITLIEVKPAPRSWDDARGAIETFLRNDRRRAAALQDMQRLRASAKIEYLDAAASMPQRSTSADVPRSQAVAGAVSQP